MYLLREPTQNRSTSIYAESVWPDRFRFVIRYRYLVCTTETFRNVWLSSVNFVIQGYELWIDDIISRWIFTVLQAMIQLAITKPTTPARLAWISMLPVSCGDLLIRTGLSYLFLHLWSLPSGFWVSASLLNYFWQGESRPYSYIAMGLIWCMCPG